MNVENIKNESINVITPKTINLIALSPAPETISSELFEENESIYPPIITENKGIAKPLTAADIKPIVTRILSDLVAYRNNSLNSTIFVD